MMTPVEIKKEAEKRIAEILNSLIAKGLICTQANVSVVDTTCAEDHKKEYIHNVKLSLSVVDTEF